MRPTGRAIPKSRSSIKSWLASWKRFWRSNGITSGRWPGFIEKEFRSFLDCGVLARGFLRIACNTCRLDRVVAFSCKSRGICPSCGGRRMADTAAHLVDHVIPDVRVRQWVLSPPHALRYRVAYDFQLLAVLVRMFIRAIFSSLRRRARACGILRGQCGAVAFVQRFGSGLNLHPHVHVLVTMSPAT